MRNGFIFNHNMCVSCNTCSAACILENGWTVQPRHIFTYNSEADNCLPVINLSLACNHCESAVCMKGCPASAFYRDEFTGAIIIDEKKCIGCRYCQWNCPYDAPKFDFKSRTVAKCNLCYSGLIEGRQPACSSACPTGALSFGQISGPGSGIIYSWFPDKNLVPSIKFTAKNNETPLKIFPENISFQSDLKQNKKGKNISGDVSLIIFSFLATISVAAIVSSFITGVYPESSIFIPVVIIAGLVSSFHLGKKFRSWRSVINIRNSPLSREIASFILYAVVSSATVMLKIPALLIASSVTGLLFLLLIDRVYIYANRNKSAILNSGQTFLSALIIVSFISGIILPFVFMALIKLGLSAYKLKMNKLNSSDVGLRFLRTAFLVVPGLSLILQTSKPDIIIISIFLAGELIDRILFYMDFNPININTLIDEHKNRERDEKKKY